MTDTNPNDISLAEVVQRDPDIHSGDLVFTGTRVPVGNFGGLPERGRTPSKNSSRTTPPSSAGNSSRTLNYHPKGSTT